MEKHDQKTGWLTWLLVGLSSLLMIVGLYVWNDNKDLTRQADRQAELYYLVNRYNDAASYTDQYIQVANDTRPKMYLHSAQCHFLAKDYQKAAEVIEKNRAALIGNPIVYRIEGWSQSSLKQPQKVIFDDRKCLGQAYLALGTAGSDSFKAQNDSIGIAYLEKAAPLDKP